MQIFPHFFQKFPYWYSFFMKMEWIWPIRGMVGKLGLYILLWQNDIRKSCFQIQISKNVRLSMRIGRLVGTPGLEPGTSAMWLQRSKPTGLCPCVVLTGCKVKQFYSNRQIYRTFFAFALLIIIVVQCFTILICAAVYYKLFCAKR